MTPLSDISINRQDDASFHLAYFDPASGPVPNPGMGISGYVSSDHLHVGFDPSEWERTQGLPPLPLDRASIDRMAALPYVDNLYIRVEWADIQRQPGRLDLPESWHWLLEAVERHGKSWGFRVMNCSPHSLRVNSGLPDFLADRLQLIRYWTADKMPGPYPKYFPVYDAEYLDRWRECVALLGEAFDAHPRLEFVDVSGYGFWGEGHHQARFASETSPKMNWDAPDADAVMERLIRDHLAAFPQTPAVLSLHAADYPAGRVAFEQGWCWPRRDSFMANFSPAEARLAQGLCPGSGMVWETIRPGCDCPTDTVPSTPGRLALPQRYFDLKAHFAAVGFNAWDMIWAHEYCQDTLAQLSRHLGYRLRPSIVWRRTLGNQPPDLVLGLVNDGCSPPPGILTITARFPDGRTTSLELPPGQPASGPMHMVALPFLADASQTRQDDELELRLTLRFKGKSAPVRWAVAGSEGGAEVLRIHHLFRCWE